MKRASAPADATRAPRAAGSGAKRTARPARPVTPRIRASHGSVPDAPGSRSSAGRRPLRAIGVDIARAPGKMSIPRKAGPASKGASGPPSRKAPLTGPKRTGTSGARPKPAATTEYEPSTQARELALALAGAAIEKKAVGIEILDVSGRIDYADFLVVMTGRSDRHVHAIATGIDEAMRQKKKHAALSIEGLATATWVLIDFGDVVVHVFQEDSRALYDIEGLWIDAGRVPVPNQDGAPDTARPFQSAD